jgi:hypothetical protein
MLRKESAKKIGKPPFARDSQEALARVSSANGLHF